MNDTSILNFIEANEKETILKLRDNSLNDSLAISWGYYCDKSQMAEERDGPGFYWWFWKDFPEREVALGPYETLRECLTYASQQVKLKIEELKKED